MNSGRAANNTPPVRSHPATIAGVGVCSAARFDGERARGNSRFEDMTQGILDGAQNAGIIRTFESDDVRYHYRHTMNVPYI
jgi:hypothetical protein